MAPVAFRCQATAVPATRGIAPGIDTPVAAEGREGTAGTLDLQDLGDAM